LKRFNKIGLDLYKEFWSNKIKWLHDQLKTSSKYTESIDFSYPEKCPYCKSNRLYQEMVDVGVCLIPVQPKECMNCGAQENYPLYYMVEDRLRDASANGLKEYFYVLQDVIHDYKRIYTTKEIALGWSCRNGHPYRYKDSAIKEDNWFNNDVPF
jgi:DNA-directed RNA polymerase subunit RPC12/RpoP